LSEESQVGTVQLRHYLPTMEGPPLHQETRNWCGIGLIDESIYRCGGSVGIAPTSQVVYKWRLKTAPKSQGGL